MYRVSNGGPFPPRRLRRQPWRREHCPHKRTTPADWPGGSGNPRQSDRRSSCGETEMSRATPLLARQVNGKKSRGTSMKRRLTATCCFPPSLLRRFPAGSQGRQQAPHTPSPSVAQRRISSCPSAAASWSRFPVQWPMCSSPTKKLPMCRSNRNASFTCSRKRAARPRSTPATRPATSSGRPTSGSDRTSTLSTRC